jgi:leader peptidase (prepilin peptidase)/N-methyltransferase
MAPAATELEPPAAPSRRTNLVSVKRVTAVVVAGALIAVTFVAVHPPANAAAYAVVQVLLVAIATVDLEQRKIPNELVIALAVVAIVARAIAERSHLLGSAVSGLIVFAVALALANLARGGLGMGDVKLAAALGLVLGKVVLLALLVGSTAGAVAALAVLVRQGKAGRRTTIAYGPYLALGAALAILVFSPPPLA